MKLVDISEFFSDFGGGVRTYVHQKLEACAEAGVEATIIAPGPADRRETRHGGEVIWVRSPALAFDHRYHLFSRSKPVHDLLDEIKPDIVEGSSTWKGAWIAGDWQGPAAERAARSLFLHQDPVAVYPHSLLSPRIDETRLDQLCFWFWAYMRRLAKSFGSVVVASEWFAARLKAHRVGKPSVIPLGVEKTTFSPKLRNEIVRRQMLAECGVNDPDAVLFIAVSRHHPEKRLGMMIDAFQLYSQNNAAGLVIIGDGPAWRTIHKRAAACPGVKIAGQIGDREDLATRIASADYFVHGGAAETFGLVIAEALSAGLPFVAPHIGGAADFAHPAYSETYRAGDAAACADAMARITGRDRQELAIAARAGGNRVNTPSDHFDVLIAHYEQLILEQRLRIAA
ncbi:MAG: glycosyltransferase [Pseudomonadota bacterium]